MTTGYAPAAAPAAVPAPDRAAEYRSCGWWRDETFLDDLRRQARIRPRKLAVAGRRLDEARTDTLDYAELSLLTDRFAGALLELGVRRGDVVAVQLPNRWEMVPLMYACMAVGAVICPIAPECQEAELSHRLQLTGARVCVTLAEWQDHPLAASITALRPQLAVEHVVVVGGRGPEGTVDFHDHFVAVPWEEEHLDDLEGRELGPDEPFVILFTSGTTGFSKGVVHSQNTVHSGVRGYVDTFLLRDDLVAVVTTPLVHYSGFGQGILAGVMLGGTVAFQDGRNHTSLLDLAERYGATLLYGPPATLFGVAAAQRADRHEVPSLRHTVTGAAPVLQELVDELRDTFDTTTYSVWGMSEFGPITISRLDYDQDWSAHSHGRPIDAMQIRIDLCDNPDKRAEVGRLRVRGASRALGYFRNQDAFDAELTADGWFDTGDVARADGRGGIRVLGRAKDAILRDGAVVPMAELEAILAAHPKIAEATLVGPHGRTDDPVVAVVVPRGGARPTLREIREHLRERGQDPRFLPDRLDLVDTLPKTLTGKVRKAELRRRLGGD
ncbi:AMP-binding protein [Streptomyces echinatus]|uniref:Cyclohexanecarboxylate-CoA ligase n=1 Tax=Streptomyces echinatus TaxID=67293 RepID=A0A7W9Q091_9ACTN|nr:AMP-binding protein [Streptomyces echinatus]MBB5930673.1 cyclohexanecarboxylate-CoA ligase [Streptomyces echinatus]